MYVSVEDFRFAPRLYAVSSSVQQDSQKLNFQILFLAKPLTWSVIKILYRPNLRFVAVF